MEILTHHTSGKQKVVRAGAALLLVGAMGSCDREHAPICNSPRAISDVYPADPHATANRSTWVNGVDIHTAPLEDTRGIVVGFRAPGKGDWHDSQPIGPRYASSIAVRIGNGAMAFSVFAIGYEGADACATEPSAVFSEMQPLAPVIEQGATQPTWLQPSPTH
jgi:hypothetical protein